MAAGARVLRLGLGALLIVAVGLAWAYRHELEGWGARMMAGLIAYRILRHRYFPKRREKGAQL